MRKEDLKTGMRVTKRNGRTSIVLRGTTNGDIISCIGVDGSWSSLNDVTFGSGSQYDIVKVEDSVQNMDYLFQYNTLVWHEVEVIEELTMEQLEKELGRKVKIVK